ALRRAEVPEGLLATWAAEETKRDFWERLLPRLETTDAGIRALASISMHRRKVTGLRCAGLKCAPVGVVSQLAVKVGRR
ncbi:MAG TPA: hypothetical protein VN428_08095, partial [Bryobacteraceae bacterium]|nr:hypothetical protein [Bryobacteraceae bacterium]